MAQLAQLLFSVGVVVVALTFAAHVGHAVMLANGRRSLPRLATAPRPAFAGVVSGSFAEQAARRPGRETIEPTSPLSGVSTWLGWVAVALLGLSLAFEPKEADVMSRPPRAPKQPLFTLPLIMRTGLVSLIMLGGGLGLFLWELRVEQAGLAVARTVVVNTIVMVQLVYLFNCRSLNHSIFAIGWFTNKWTIFGSLAMLAAQLLFTYAPVMNKLFHTAPIDAASWLRIVGVAAVAFVAVELEKWIRFGRRSERRPDLFPMPVAQPIDTIL